MKSTDEILKGTNDDQRFIVLLAVEDCPVPPTSAALERRCQGCGRAVWIAPATIQFLISRGLGEKWKLMCNTCADPVIASDPSPTFVSSASFDALQLIEIPKPPKW